ncbi:hypothetical protein BDZ94DRAFT_1258148, partial [Collybia nuda]
MFSNVYQRLRISFKVLLTPRTSVTLSERGGAQFGELRRLLLVARDLINCARHPCSSILIIRFGLIS